jgi:hypothetical protein
MHGIEESAPSPYKVVPGMDFEAVNALIAGNCMQIEVEVQRRPEGDNVRWRQFDSQFWLIQLREYNGEVYFSSRDSDQ